MKKTALITGASSGIGLELAKVMAKDGNNLILIARTKKKLDELAKELRKTHQIEVKVIAKDLSEDTAAQEIFEELEKSQIEVDILVNNAGLGLNEKFAEMDMNQAMQMLKVNIVALTQLTKPFLLGMVERKWGRIMQVASVGSFMPGPNMAIYFATKAYVLSFSEAIAQELKGTGVTVTALCPGVTRTDFFETAEVQVPSNVLTDWTIQTTQEVAESGYKAMKSGKVVHVTGLLNNLSVLSTPLVPRQILMPMMDFMIKSFGKH